jgi:hypothetical protein
VLPQLRIFVFRARQHYTAPPLANLCKWLALCGRRYGLRHSTELGPWNSPTNPRPCNATLTLLLFLPAAPSGLNVGR